MYGIGTFELLIILVILAMIFVPFIALGFAVYWLFLPKRKSDEQEPRP